MTFTSSEAGTLRNARATAVIAGRATAAAIRSAAHQEESNRIRHHLLYAEQRALQTTDELAALIEAAMDEKHNEAHPEDAGDEPERSGAEREPQRTAR